MQHTNPNLLKPDYIKNPKPYSKQRGQGYLPAFFNQREQLMFVSRHGVSTALSAKQRAGWIHLRWLSLYSGMLMTMINGPKEEEVVTTPVGHKLIQEGFELGPVEA